MATKAQINKLVNYWTIRLGEIDITARMNSVYKVPSVKKEIDKVQAKIVDTINVLKSIK